MKLGNLSLQTRFVGSVAATIVAVVGAGVIWFSASETSRITNELHTLQHQQLTHSVQLIDATNSLVADQASSQYV